MRTTKKREKRESFTIISDDYWVPDLEISSLDTDTTQEELPLPDSQASIHVPATPASIGSGGELETVFQQAETSLVNASKSIAALAKAVRSGIEAAKAGDVRTLSKAVQNAQAALRDIQPSLQESNRALETDFAATLRNGSFAEEIVSVATHAGLRGVRHIQGAVLSFPIVLFPNADALGVRFGRKISSSLRPSAVVARLQKLRKQQRSQRAMLRLVDAIERAYLLRTQNKIHMPVPLQAIYELLTPMPGQGDEYTELDFVADLYMLERAGALTSSNGRQLSFPASTSTKFKKSIRIATEDGEERLYSSIRFD